jgi:hypothetical protein
MHLNCVFVFFCCFCDPNVSSPSTDFDTVLNVYEEVSEADCAVTCLDRSDDHGLDLDVCSPNVGHSLLGFQNLPPGTYYVAVSGYAEADVGACVGQFELEFQTLSSDDTEPPMAPVAAPTKVPVLVVPTEPAPTPPTVAPVDKPRRTPAPIDPEDSSVAETDLSIAYQPVLGPFGGPLGVEIVQMASSAFFSELLFGGSRDGDSARIVEVELSSSEVVELEDQVARSKLLVELNVKTTYDGEEDFKGALVRLIDDNQDLYISILQRTESELSEELGNDNLEYFSLVQTITEVGEEPGNAPTTSAPNSAPPSVQIDSGANLVGFFTAPGLIVGLAVFGILLEAL